MVWIKTNTLFVAGEQRRQAGATKWLGNERYLPVDQAVRRTDRSVAGGIAPNVVICHHGARSQMVVDFLRNAGFDNAVNLDGGIDAWACEIDQSMRRYR